MISQARTHVAPVLLAALLTGCATMSEIEPRDIDEYKIFVEAMSGGAAIGAIGGGVAAYASSGACRGDDKDQAHGDDKDQAKCTLVTATGAALGAGLGMLAGQALAMHQVSNLRDYQMGNQEFERLLQTAQQRNQELADYNQQLARDIARLKKESKAARAQLASVKLKEAEQKRKRFQHLISNRQDLASKLVPAQRAQYEQTLSSLKREDGQLDQSMQRLSAMAPVVVGGASGGPKP
jgi:paraquat-inducible protein B